MVHVRVLSAGDEALLEHLAEDVFDRALDRELTALFLANPHNHLAVAIEEGVVAGFASGIDYVHADKPRQMWINEVGVSPASQRRGIGRALLLALLGVARERGCTEAWVLTEDDNAPVRALYRNAGG